MPSLKNINQRRQMSKIRHKKSSTSIEDVDDQRATLEILKVELQNAVTAGNDKKVEELLAQAKGMKENDEALKELFSYHNSTGESILCTASYHGYINIVKMLIDAAANIDDDVKTLTYLLLSTDASGKNSLHTAALSQDVKMAIMLLKVAKNVDDNNKTLINLLLSTESSGRTALHISTSLDSIDVTAMLLYYARAVNDNNKTIEKLILAHNTYNRTALHLGSLYGHIDVVTELLNAAKIIGNTTLVTLLFYQDRDGDNALHTTSINGHANVATKLFDIAKSININTARNLILSCNFSNKTALHIAADHADDRLMTKLISIASDISAKEEHNVLQKLLLTYTRSGESVLHIAARNTNEKLIISLLDAIKNIGDGSIMNELLFHIDIYDDSPLYTSILNKNPVIFRNIMNAAKDVSTSTFASLMLYSTRLHDTVLHTLVCNKKNKLIELSLHMTRSLDQVEDSNAEKDIGKYVNVAKEISTGDPKNIKSVNCTDDTKFDEIITCFDKTKFANIKTEEDHIIDVDKVKNANADKCISKAECVNLADDINLNHCVKVINHLDAKNHMLRRLLWAPNKSGDNVLHVAVSNGYYDMINKLLDQAKYIDTCKYNYRKNHIDVDICTDASKVSDSKIIRDGSLVTGDQIYKVATKKYMAMLLNKININEKPTFINYLLSTNKSGDTVLHIAAKTQNILTIKELLKTAKEIEDDDHTVKELLLSTNKSGDTVLHIAAKTQNVFTTKELLRAAKEIGDGDHTIKELLLSTDKLGDTAACKAYYIEAKKTYTITELLITEARKLNILKSLIKINNCVMDIEKHEDSTDSNMRIKRDIKHKIEATDHYDDGQESLQSTSTASLIRSIFTKEPKLNAQKDAGNGLIHNNTDDYNTPANQSAITGFDIGGILMLSNYLLPNQSTSNVHYISPHNQRIIELNELESDVQALLGKVVDSND